MLKALIEKIARPNISDLHMKVNEPPMIRQMGQLIAISSTNVKREDIETILNTLMDESQKARLNETGDIDFSQTYEGIGRLRVNVYRQQGTYAVALRLIPKEARSFEELHLPKETLEKLGRVTKGLVLISGMTGAGKTTTLNALINYMNENFSYNIITMEDPVEFIHTRKKSSISQREIGKDVPTLSEALRYVFRQDPDIIVLGEVRTADEFRAAIEGAASGHLILTTVHSSDTFDALDRIVNAFDPQVQIYMRTQLMNVITAVVSQRLVPDKTGKAMFPVNEILFGTLQMKKLLTAGSITEAKFLMERGSAYGMRTFDQDLLKKAEDGIITQQEALNFASNPNDLRLKFQGAAGPTGGVDITK